MLLLNKLYNPMVPIRPIVMITLQYSTRRTKKSEVGR